MLSCSILVVEVIQPNLVYDAYRPDKLSLYSREILDLSRLYIFPNTDMIIKISHHKVHPCRKRPISVCQVRAGSLQRVLQLRMSVSTLSNHTIISKFIQVIRE
jgi:hypothetical protein